MNLDNFKLVYIFCLAVIIRSSYLMSSESGSNPIWKFLAKLLISACSVTLDENIRARREATVFNTHLHYIHLIDEV